MGFQGKKAKARYSYQGQRAGTTVKWQAQFNAGVARRGTADPRDICSGSGTRRRDCLYPGIRKVNTRTANWNQNTLDQPIRFVTGTQK